MTDVQQSPADIELQSTKSTIPDHEAQASLLFPNRPEIKRTIAIYNYHAVGGVGFGFDAGDQLSVRDFCYTDVNVDGIWWFGINLKTLTAGFFPSSYVKDISLKEEEPCEALASEEEQLANLASAFHTYFGEDADPISTFKTISHLKNVDSHDFWLSFAMAHPKAALGSIELHKILSALHRILFKSPYSREKFSLSNCSAENYRWSFYNHVFNLGLWRRQSDQERWECVKVLFHDAIPRAAQAWDCLRPEVQAVEEGIPHLSGITKRLDGLIPLLVTQLDLKDLEVKEYLESDAKKVREYERNIVAEEENIKMGLSKTNSMSSGTDIKDSDVKIKNRWGRKAQRKSPNNVNVSSNSIIQLPLHRRIYYQWDEFIFKAKRRMRWMLNMMGETPAVLTTVISLSIASAVTTGLATWQCSPPDTIPTIDSNFWSTVASAAIGIAGLYCTIIPILLEQKIKVQNETLFHGLLWFSFLTAVVAVVVYPFQTRASLVLLFASAAAQLATTLQIILGAVTKIQEDVVRIREQDTEIADLKRRVR